MTREQMIKRIMRERPSCGLATIERYAQHWPENVTPQWLLENAQRGGETVPDADRLWLACCLMPGLAKRCARLWANRQGLTETQRQALRVVMNAGRGRALFSLLRSFGMEHAELVAEMSTEGRS